MKDKLLAEWFWLDRWDGSSAMLLPMEARGVYREMLSQAWRRGARLPNDEEAIQRAIRCTSAEWERAWPSVKPYWHESEDGFLVNDTQVEVYAEALERATKASARGQKGAQARAQALLKQRSSTTQAELERKPPSPSPSPSQEQTHRGHGADDGGGLGEVRRQASSLLTKLVERGLDGQRELLRASRTQNGATVTNAAAIPTEAWGRVIVERLTARWLELSERDAPEESTEVDPAAAWVGERGGPAACADSVLLITAGDATPSKVRAALKKANAPTGVYGLIGSELQSAAR